MSNNNTLPQLKKFSIEVHESASKVVTVEALDLEDAYLKVNDQWRSGEITLDSSDHDDMELLAGKEIK